MPYDQINRYNSVNYSRYVQKNIPTFIGTLSYATPYAALKAQDPPKGNDGALAVLVNRGLAGVGTLPSVLIYMWINNETSADNGTTILRPSTYASDATAGRWMAVSLS